MRNLQLEIGQKRKPQTNQYHLTTIILYEFKSHQVLTNLWETDNMNNAIFS